MWHVGRVNKSQDSQSFIVRARQINKPHQPRDRQAAENENNFNSLNSFTPATQTRSQPERVIHPTISHSAGISLSGSYECVAGS